MSVINEVYKLAVDREALNAHIRDLQEKKKNGEKYCTLGWDIDELESVLANGLGVLSEEKLLRLLKNPVQLFILYSSIMEEDRELWSGAVLADAKRLASGNERLRQKKAEFFEMVSKKLPLNG